MLRVGIVGDRCICILMQCVCGWWLLLLLSCDLLPVRVLDGWVILVEEAACHQPNGECRFADASCAEYGLQQQSGTWGEENKQVRNAEEEHGRPRGEHREGRALGDAERKEMQLLDDRRFPSSKKRRRARAAIRKSVREWPSRRVVMLESSVRWARALLLLLLLLRGGSLTILYSSACMARL